MDTIIRFFDIYANELKAFNNNAILNTDCDTIVLASKHSFNNFLLLHQIPVHELPPSVETHYVTTYRDNLKITSSYSFGLVAHSKYLKKVTRNYDLNSDYVNSNSLFVWKNKQPNFVATYTVYDEGYHVTFTHMFGHRFDDNISEYSVMLYENTPKEVIRMLACKEFVHLKFNIWNYLIDSNLLTVTLWPTLPIVEKVSPRKVRYADACVTTTQMFSSLSPVNLVADAMEDKFSDALSSLSEMMETFPDMLTDKLKIAGSEVITDGRRKVGAICFCVAIGSTLYYIASGNNDAKVCALATGGVCAVLFSPEIFENISVFLVDKTYPQDNDDNKGIYTKVFEVFSEYFPTFSLKKLKDYSFLLTGFAALKNGLNAALCWLFESVDRITQYILGKRVIPVSWYENVVTEKRIMNFVERLDTFDADLVCGTVPYSTQSFAIVKDLIDECVNVQLAIPRSSGGGAVLDKCFRKLMNIKGKFGPMDGHGRNRIEPVCVMIRGGPGAKKSFIMDSLIECILVAFPVDEVPGAEYTHTKFNSNYSKSRKEHANRVYYRSVGNKYHDGGENNPLIWCYDDFGQARDTPGQEHEYTEMIAVKNSRPFQLHMSNIEDKKDCYFRSKFVIGTTNVVNFKPEVIISAGALNRRIDLDIVVCAKKEYCIDPNADMWHRQFDEKRVPSTQSYEGHNVMDLNVDMFDMYLIRADVKGSEVLGQIDFKDLVSETLAIQQKYEGVFTKNKEVIANNVNETVAYLKHKGIVVDDVPVLGGLHELKDDKLGYKFMSVFESKYGQLKQSYSALWNNLVSKYKTQIVHSVMNDECEVFLSTAMLEVDKINDIKFDDTDYKALVCPDFSLATKLRSFMSDHKYILSAAGMISLLFAAKTLFADRSTTEEQSTIGVLPKKDNVKMKSLQEIQQEYNKTHNSVPQDGIDADPNCDMITLSMLRRSTCAMFIDEKQIGQCIFIAGTLCVMPCHFVRKFSYYIDPRVGKYKGSDVVTFKTNNGLGVNYKHHKVSYYDILSNMVFVPEMEAYDLVGVRLPEYFPARPNIVKHLKCRADFKTEYNDVLFRIISHPVNLPVETRTLRGKGVRELDHTVYDADGTMRTQPVSYRVNIPTSGGDCGAIYAEINKKSQSKILGLHVAGRETQKFGIMTPLYREWAEIMLDAVTGDTINPMITSNFEDSIDFTNPQTLTQMSYSDRFVYIQPGPVIRGMTKSTWTKSGMVGAFCTPQRLPSVLHPVKREVDGFTRIVDPLSIGLHKYNNSTDVYIPSDWITHIVSSEIDFLHHNGILGVEVKILSPKEAIVGIDDEIDLSPMNRKTSPGYKFLQAKAGQKGKRAWFGGDEHYTLDSPLAIQFLNLCNEQDTELRKGNLPVYICVDNLKDELRPIEKVQLCKTRIFSATEMDLNFHFKRYFGSFMAWCTKNRISISYCIGINPYSTEWDMIARKLLSKSARVNAGDFEAFDAKHSPQLLSAAFGIIDWFYRGQTNEERTVRRTLWTTLYVSYHSINGEIYRWDTSLPSGHPMTALINCIMNRFYHKYCYVRLLSDSYGYKKFDYRTSDFWNFNKNVMFFCYGDDSLMNCKPEQEDIYNEVTLPAPMLELGQVYTPETKEVANGKIRNVNEVTFLKRNFRFEKMFNGYVAPMRLDTLVDMVNWTRVYDSDIILRDKCTIIAREFSLHSESVACKHIAILNRAFTQYFGYGMECTNRLALLEAVTNDTMPSCVVDYQMMDIDKENIYVKALSDKTTNPVTQPKIAMGERTVYQMDAPLIQSKTLGDSADMQFNDDAVVNIQGKPQDIVYHDLNTDIINSDDSNGLSRYLERPAVIDNGIFASTDTATTFPFVPWSLALYTDTLQTQAKIQGVMSIKATLNVKLVINANPANQGLYKLVWVPSGGVSISSNASTLWNKMHAGNKYQMIQLGGVYANLGKDTEVSLRIPWASGHTGMLLSTTQSGWQDPGYYKIYPIVPFATGTGGTTSATWTLWAWYSDITLGGVTITQMGDVTAKEQMASKPSQVLDVVSKATGTLSRIPLLTPFMSPVSWATRILAGTARSFGWSKPSNISVPHRLTNTSTPFMAVCDGEDNCESLGMTADNHVLNHPGLTGTMLDEMAINYVAGIEGWAGLITFATTDTQATTFTLFPLSPAQYFNAITDGAVGNIRQHTPISWLLTWFSLWRGSLIYTFRFAKTQLHSGRVMIGVVYGDVQIGTLVYPTVEQSWFTYREIVDLRERDEVQLCVPYVNIRPWSDNALNNSIGQVYIRSIDALTGPSIVPTSISCLVTVKGGPDFAVASPCNNQQIPIQVTNYQMGEVGRVTLIKNIGATELIDKTLEAQQVSQGEAITSLRQLIKRFGVCYNNALGGTVTNQHVFRPFGTFLYYSNGTVSSGTATSTTRDLYTHLQCMYALSRGGVRLSFVPLSTNTTSTLHASIHHANSTAGNLTAFLLTSTTTTLSNFYWKYNGEGYNWSPSLSNAPGYLVPQNTDTVSRINAYDICTSNQPIDYDVGYPDFTQFAIMSPNTSNGYTLFRAGADDIQFGAFVSIPPMFLDQFPPA